MAQDYVFGIGELLFDLLPAGKQIGGAPVNFSYHLAQCGFQAIPVSAVGQDENGKELLEIVRSKGLSTEGISVNALPTGTAGVQFINGKNVFSISEPAAWDRLALSAALLDKAPKAVAVCFGTLAQRGEWNQKIIGYLLTKMPMGSLRILDVNFRQKYYTETVVRNSLKLCNVLKVSDEEYSILAALLNLSGNELESLEQLAKTYHLRNILFTRGDKGASMLSNGKWIHQPCLPCPAVVDTVGCGDGFTSYWTAAVLNGKNDIEALKTAGEAASFIAGKPGAMPEMPRKIIDFSGNNRKQ